MATNNKLPQLRGYETNGLSDIEQVESLTDDFERESVRREDVSPGEIVQSNNRSSQHHEDHFEKDVRNINQVFSPVDAGFGFFSIVFFFIDIVTDIVVANDYFNQRNTLAFTLTTIFIAVPSVITCLLNLRWYMLDYRKCHEDEFCERVPTSIWLTRFILTLFMMGPVVRQIEYLYRGFKSGQKGLSEEEKDHQHRLMREENKDACSLRMFECFFEAAPQLMIQIYIVTKQFDSIHIEWKQTASMLTSWLGMSWSMVAYKKALRLSCNDEEKFTIEGPFFLFLWRVSEIGPRVVVLGLFASQFGYLVFIILVCHWIVMSVWLICQKTQFHHNRCEEVIFNIVCGFILIFCFLDVRGGVTRYKMLVYYFIFYVENCTMIGLWLHLTGTKGQWFYVPTFFVVPVGMILQIVFQIVYYRCFHPLGRGKIPCCIKTKSCYQYLCYELENDESNE